MSRFDRTKQHKSAIDWSVIAYKTADEDKAATTVVLGLAVGVALCAVSPMLGGVAGCYFAVKGIQAAIASDKNKKYIKNAGCVAHVLEAGDFRAYLHQVGEDVVVQELEFADQEGLAFSNEAIDFYEEYVEKQELQRALSPASGADFPQQTHSQAPVPVLQPTTVIEDYDPSQEYQINLIGEMTDRISNTLIIGIAGSGKGMLVSNALRIAKQKHPGLKVFVIDPKADPDERGYFEGVADVVKRFPCENQPDEVVVRWVEKCFDEYYQYVNQNGRTLLFLDEGMAVGSAAERLKNTLVQNKISSISSLGDKSGKNIWIAAQAPFVGGLGIKLSASSQMLAIAIVSEANIGTFKQWSRSSILEKISLDDLTRLIHTSKVRRAVYFGKTAQWYAMPQLTNYSGFDRDTRSYLPGFTPPPKGENLSRDYEAIARLEGFLNSSDEPQDTIPTSKLSPSAELLLSYFDNVKQKTPKALADLKDANKLRQLDSNELLKAIRELVVAEELIFDVEGRYLKPDWE